MNTKSFAIVFLVVSSSTLSYTQGFFPLQVGNVWQFYEDPMHPYIQTESIIADTVLGNGQSYAVYSGLFFPGRFLRQLGSKILYFSPTDSTEHTLLDFAANVGDTVSRQQVEPFWIILAAKSTNSYFQQQQWQFAFGNGTLTNGCWTIVDSLGLFGVLMEPGVTWTLTGARIDGVVRYGSITLVSNLHAAVPKTTSLYPNYPNPFNPSTTIKYELPKSSMVRVSVYDMLGCEVSMLVNEGRDAGVHEVKFDGSGLASGVYLYRLRAGAYIQTRKLLLIR